MDNLNQKKLELPEGIKIVGRFKLKDKTNRDIVSFPIGSEVEGIIIQKAKGQNNTIIVAVKLYDKKKIEEAQKKLGILVDLEKKQTNKTEEEVKNEILKDIKVNE